MKKNMYIYLYIEYAGSFWDLSCILIFKDCLLGSICIYNMFFQERNHLIYVSCTFVGRQKIAHTCCLEGAKKEHIYVSGRDNFGRPALFLSFNLPKPTHDFAVTVPKKMTFQSLWFMHKGNACVQVLMALTAMQCHPFICWSKDHSLFFLHHLFNMLHGNMKEKSYRGT